MRPTFERGDPDRPRGHALVYFRASNDPDLVLASYLVVPPIVMDLSRYVPPMFAGQLPAMLSSGPSVFPLPPIPERVESLAQLRALAAVRDDDLLDGGSVDANDVQRLLMVVTDIAGEYGRLYTSFADRIPEQEPEPTEPEALPGVDVDELLMSVMTDAEKVGKLAKLTGTVRYALDGGDMSLLSETVGEMERIGHHLRAEYRVAELLIAVQDPAPRGGQLTTLLIERCYKLAAEDYTAIKALDAEIDKLSAPHE